MSAKNWKHCFNCEQVRVREVTERRQSLLAQYGTIDAELFASLMYRIEWDQKNGHENMEETFREDYSVGMNDDGTFRASYRGLCEECGFEFSHVVELTADQVRGKK